MLTPASCLLLTWTSAGCAWRRGCARVFACRHHKKRYKVLSMTSLKRFGAGAVVLLMSSTYWMTPG